MKFFNDLFNTVSVNFTKTNGPVFRVRFSRVLIALGIILVLLKLSGLVEITWLFATFPFWLPFAIIAAFMTIILGFTGILFILEVLCGLVAAMCEKIKNL